MDVFVKKCPLVDSCCRRNNCLLACDPKSLNRNAFMQVLFSAPWIVHCRQKIVHNLVIFPSLTFTIFTPLPPPWHFYCFTSITTTTTITFLLFSLHHDHHISTVFPPAPPLILFCLTSPTTTILLFSLLLHHHHYISIVFPPPPPSTLFLFNFHQHQHHHHHQIDYLKRRSNRPKPGPKSLIQGKIAKIRPKEEKELRAIYITCLFGGGGGKKINTFLILYSST